MVDMFASEYGWSAERVLDLPCDAAAMLSHAVLYRKGAKVRLRSPGVDSTATPLAERVGEILGQIDNDA